MKISLRWLQDYIDVQEYMAKPKELAALLTAAGLEVESIQDLAKPFASVVVGHILEKGQHPNADRLSLCQVTTGEGKIHQIVCGAQNHKAGDRVVVALPGAVLPGDFAIKHSKIRGVESAGMLCSEVELGLEKESEGILILPATATIGMKFADYMGYDDIVLELKVTPNRADCLSHIGLAREIASLTGAQVKMPDNRVRESAKSTKELVGLVVQSELCPRYSGRSVLGTKVSPSPDWLRKRLESVGVNSINNVVDITNFVMLECGQPLHAFDVRELHGRKVQVALAQKGEKFTTLDGTELEMQGDELTIRDETRIVALAGVVGGLNSGIRNDTSEVFIESAFFVASHVRRNARRFGVETDSSYRFARGVNPEGAAWARDRAAHLMQELAHAEVAADPYDYYPTPVVAPEIVIDSELVSLRLGFAVTAEELAQQMMRLGCEVTRMGASNQMKVVPPLSRGDISMEMDLVEEYARLHGYQHIPETVPNVQALPAKDHPHYRFENRIRELMKAQGYNEAVNFAFLSEKYQAEVLGDAQLWQQAGLRSIEKPVALKNPLNEELGVMRTALLPGLLKNISHNSRQGNSFGALFEVGFAHYQKEDQGEGASFEQEGRLGLARWGVMPQLWSKEAPANVFVLKSALESVLRSLGLAKLKWVQAAGGEVPACLHPGQTAWLSVEGKNLGFVGTLHPELLERYKIRENVAVAELNLDKLAVGQPRTPKFKSISRFPAVERDLAFVMRKDLPVADVESLIRQSAGALLTGVTVFDVFAGGQLARTDRSVAFRLVFQDPNGTLEDAKVNELRDKVVAQATAKLGVQLR